MPRASRRPILHFDVEYSSCRKWARRWRARTGKRVRFVSVTPLGTIPELGFLKPLAKIPLVRFVARTAYRLISRHRRIAAWLDWIFFGETLSVPRARLVRAVYLRAFAFCAFVAFTSLRRQVLGLYGSRGILPIREYLERLQALRVPSARRFGLVPTLFWWSASDRALVNACRAGQLSSILLAAGVAPRAMLGSIWALYLSFVSTGRDFLMFQWDVLLLETALASLPAASKRGEPSWLAKQLLRLLFARLYFESGLCKIQSRDPHWRDGTACAFHFETQPLPTRLGWQFHQLPLRAQCRSTRAALAIELILPPLVFSPRRTRRIAYTGLSLFQLLIAATGNYGFFNFLTLSLALWAADDAFLERLLGRDSTRPGAPGPIETPWRRALESALALPLLAASATALAERIPKGARVVERTRALGPLVRLRDRLSRAHSLNSYGLFSVMTITRPEIIVEGSRDGMSWRPYEFRYKPGDPAKPPRWVAPHQPRLDWQLWFAAMQGPPGWFLRFVQRLLEGSPDVLGLLENNPFPDAPPRYVRARLYRYRMTRRHERRNTGHWWRREFAGDYLPPCRLSSESEVLRP